MLCASNDTQPGRNPVNSNKTTKEKEWSHCIITFLLFSGNRKGKERMVALRPHTPKHIRGGWSHYTDTSETGFKVKNKSSKN
jgi:hypothetical protein